MRNQVVITCHNTDTQQIINVGDLIFVTEFGERRPGVVTNLDNFANTWCIVCLLDGDAFETYAEYGTVTPMTILDKMVFEVDRHDS